MDTFFIFAPNADKAESPRKVKIPALLEIVACPLGLTFNLKFPLLRTILVVNPLSL